MLLLLVRIYSAHHASLVRTHALGPHWVDIDEIKFFYSDQIKINESVLTAPFNNMRTIKFKAQPTNAFFATVNQMFGGSSQPPTTAERAVIKSNRLDNIVRSWDEPPNS